jgi:type II secretory pathway predicted ATPase ExeA
MNAESAKVMNISTRDEAGLPGTDLFSGQPFECTRDSQYYYAAASHEKAVSRLFDMVHDGNQGFAVLSGDSGLGKTLIRTVLHRRLDSQRFVRVSIETSLLGFDEMLLEIISQIQGDRVHAADLPDRYSRLALFKTLLSDRIIHSGRHLVLMLDEAQGLDRATLEGLRNLSNISAEKQNLMSVGLFGGTQLDNLVQGLPALRQRIGEQLILAPLDSSETHDYVNHRLRTAGSPRTLSLADTTWARLHRVSGGIPRNINRIMKSALNSSMSSENGLDDTCLMGVLDRSGGRGITQLDHFA